MGDSPSKIQPRMRKFVRLFNSACLSCGTPYEVDAVPDSDFFADMRKGDLVRFKTIVRIALTLATAIHSAAWRLALFSHGRPSELTTPDDHILSSNPHFLIAQGRSLYWQI